MKIAGDETSGAEKSWGWKVSGVKSLGGEKTWGWKVLGVKHLGGEKSRGEKIWGWKVLGVKSLGGEKSWGWKVLGVKSLGGERSWGWNSRYEKSGAETSRAEQSCSPIDKPLPKLVRSEVVKWYEDRKKDFNLHLDLNLGPLNCEASVLPLLYDCL